MKIIVLALSMLFICNSAYASHWALKNHSHSEFNHDHEEHDHTGNDRNFYVPLEAEVNVTPQRFRTRHFQGIFSTSGVEVGGNEPVWFTGAIAKFDVFPEPKEEDYGRQR